MAKVIWDVNKLWARYFDQIGVELEGGWDDEAHNRLNEYSNAVNDGYSEERDRYGDRRRLSPAERRAMVPMRLSSDGSVDVDAEYVGEVPVGPTPDLQKMFEVVRKLYPNRVNKTCGLHVHLSFKKDLFYLRLMAPEVTTTLCNHLGEWGRRENLPASHPLWHRLAGENSFCMPEYKGEEQVIDRSKSGHRYTVINYCKALHNTIEVRVLPAFNNSDQAIRGIEAVIYSLGMQLRERRGTIRNERTLERVVGDMLSARSVTEFRVARRAYEQARASLVLV